MLTLTFFVFSPGSRILQNYEYHPGSSVTGPDILKLFGMQIENLNFKLNDRSIGRIFSFIWRQDSESKEKSSRKTGISLYEHPLSRTSEISSIRNGQILECGNIINGWTRVQKIVCLFKCLF